MLRGAFAALLVVALGVTGAATAQNVVLSAREARSELFGVRLSGFNERISAPWTECIEPSGRTVYDYVGARREGRLSITEDGRACFAYADTNFSSPSCFVVVRESANYRFDAFVTRRVERGIERCEGGDGLIAARAAHVGR